MKNWTFLILSLLLTSTALADVKAYFNQNSRNSYVDPYRNFLRNGDNLEKVLIDEVRKARKSIYIAVQEFRLPLLAAAIIEKYKQGLDVRLIIEHDYNFTVESQKESGDEGDYEVSKLAELRALVDMNRNGVIEKSELEARDAIYMLGKARIPTMDDTFDTSAGSGLMHHKFAVIDGRTAIISTANFTLSCIHGDITAMESRGNPNSMVVVDSMSFAKFFTDEFMQMWGNGVRGNFGLSKTYRGPQTATVGKTRLTVQFSPTSQRYQWEETTNGLIGAQLAKAQRSIKAALFVFSDQKLADLMQKAHNRGASVGVMMEPKFAYRDYSELLDLMGVEMKNASCIYEPENNPWKSKAEEIGVGGLPNGDVLHHKFGVIDGRIVVMGSQNWSDSANSTNDETLIVIEDTEISDQYTQEYNRLMRGATKGAPDWFLDQIKKQDVACADKGLY